MALPMMAGGEAEEEGDDRYSKSHGSYCLAQRLRVADRADLGDVAAERQAGGPVDHRAGLAGGARDLAHVVAAGHPPGGEAAEGALADLADRLVAAEVDEGRVCRGTRTAARCRRRARRRCCGRRPGPGGRRAGRSADRCPPRGSGAAAQSPIAQTESMPWTRRCSSTGTRPRSSSGTSSSRRLGCGATPAVQTTVRVGSVSPVESRARVGARPPPASCRGGCRCRGRAARAARSRRARRRSPAGPGRSPRPGSSASRAGERAGSSPSRRRRSPAARPAPRGRRSRRRRRRR